MTHNSTIRRQSSRPIAAVTALTLHIALALALSKSLAGDPPRFDQPLDTGAMFASLTPATALSEGGLVQSQALDQMQSHLYASRSPRQVVSSAVDASFLDQMEASPTGASKPSAPSAGPSATAAPVSPARPSPVTLKQGDSPWALASVASADPTHVQGFWAAIRPCWRGSSTQPAAAIRVLVDGEGRVQSMTSLAGGEADAQARAQAVARAIVACEPYARVVGEAGTYLVVAPG